ncbi:transcriptional regulator, TetR family [Rhodococcus wratislaviensis]|uniref:Transcriptional regulator, TetR family n=1 Tax=Rhodococcus wratislaviensis TaxID=44752 RepID=A0A402C4D2_RHOWR|nr:transcriptional regulator, TetR family [Rhodococcus wratislaviensis]
MRSPRAILSTPSTRRRFARFVIGAFTGVQTVSRVLTHRVDLEQ